jgi:glycosyl transferase family 25
MQAETRAGEAPRPLEIVVISLAGAEARRRLMRAQLEPPGMPPHRILDAVDGRRLEGPQLTAVYEEAAALRHASRSLTPPEIGCAASHLAAYRHIVAQGTAVTLVLEDDALLGRLFLDVLERVVPMMNPGQPQAVLLSHVVRYSAWAGRRVDKRHSLYRPYEAYGAHAYVITLAGARAMLSALYPVRTAADDWAYVMKAGILEVSALIPYVVGTSPLSWQSQIGNERFHQQERAQPKWARLCDRLVFQLLIKPALRLRRHEQTW